LILLRGNHEGWTRAGPGWSLLLSPHPRARFDTPWPEESAPYVLHFDRLTMAILDVANADDGFRPDRRGAKYTRWLADLSTTGSDGKKPSETWLLQHIPYWVSIKCAADPCVQPVGNSPLDAMRQWMRNDTASPKFDLLLSGDTHMFQFFVPENAEIPEQVIAG